MKVFVYALNGLTFDGEGNLVSTNLIEYERCAWVQRAYKYMHNQMTKRVPCPDDCIDRTPITMAFATDSVSTDTHPFGGLFLECDVPDDQVVIFNDDIWVSCLNGNHSLVGAIPEDCSDDEFDKLYDEFYEKLDSLSAAERDEVIERSWDCMFDVASISQERIHAAVWKIHPEWIIRSVFVRPKIESEDE